MKQKHKQIITYKSSINECGSMCSCTSMLKHTVSLYSVYDRVRTQESGIIKTHEVVSSE